MAIAKEDIKEGFYWVLDRSDRTLDIVSVTPHQSRGLCVGWLKSAYTDYLSAAVQEVDFVARIEPPEGM
jgi:hypothetical protein